MLNKVSAATIPRTHSSLFPVRPCPNHSSVTLAVARICFTNSTLLKSLFANTNGSEMYVPFFGSVRRLQGGANCITFVLCTRVSKTAFPGYGKILKIKKFFAFSARLHNFEIFKILLTPFLGGFILQKFASIRVFYLLTKLFLKSTLELRNLKIVTIC